jgi:hypothetical protein
MVKNDEMEWCLLSARRALEDCLGMDPGSAMNCLCVLRQAIPLR